MRNAQNIEESHCDAFDCSKLYVTIVDDSPFFRLLLRAMLSVDQLPTTTAEERETRQNIEELIEDLAG